MSIVFNGGIKFSHHACIICTRGWRFLAHNKSHGQTDIRRQTISYPLFANSLRLLRHFSSAAHQSSSNITSGNKNRNDTSDDRAFKIPDRCVSIVDDNCQAIVDRIPLQDVRNFCFIAHVDHGKSSLTSRLLEITGNMGRESQKFALESARGNASASGTYDEKDADNNDIVSERVGEKEQIQLLDTLAVERERGITVKASAASMLYPHPSAVGPDGVLLLNCVDTPGHSDFSSEVTRSLSFVQGAILLLDATQGIQAQSWTVYEKAKSMINPPEIILAMTKVDLDAARPIDVALAVAEWLSIDDPESIIPTSARNRIGIVPLLDAICWRVPSPQPMPDDKNICTEGTDDNSHLRVQVVDSWYDTRGVNCVVQVISGSIKEGDRIVIIAEMATRASQQSASFSIQEVGIVLPRNHRTGRLHRGQMGYIRFSLKDPSLLNPGTILISQKDVGVDFLIPSLNHNTTDKKDINGSETSSQSVLYASVHAKEEDGFDDLCDAVDRLALNDKGLEVTRTGGASGSNTRERGLPFLGPGLRIGFQGVLHVEVFRQRLFDEFGIEAMVTPPRVPYRISYVPSKRNNLTEPITKLVEDLEEWPDFGTKFKVEEPMVKVRLMAPVQYAGAVMELITKKRGIEMETTSIDENSWMFEAQIPWAEVVVSFHDMLKTATAGYGSLDTFKADPPFREARLSKVDILLNSEAVDPLSFVCYTPNAQADARIVCKKLHEILPRQQFVTLIQGKADGKIIASERIQAHRKNVLDKSGKSVGGGDISRKKKLLDKQKQGKKRAQKSGTITLSQAAFNSVISR